MADVTRRWPCQTEVNVSVRPEDLRSYLAFVREQVAEQWGGAVGPASDADLGHLDPAHLVAPDIDVELWRAHIKEFVAAVAELHSEGGEIDFVDASDDDVPGRHWMERVVDRIRSQGRTKVTLVSPNEAPEIGAEDSSW